MAGTKVCKYIKCGKEFIPEKKGIQYCCVECRTKQNRERAREKERVKRESIRKRRRSKATLKDISKEARKLGMSYGQYVAQMEMQKGVT